MKRKSIITLIIILFVLSALCVFASCQPPQGGDDIFITDTKGTITALTQKGADMEELIVPSQIGDETITRIGNEAFSHCHAKSIVIPDSVTSIGEGAISSCNRLESVDISLSKVTSIGASAFASSNFKSIVIPDRESISDLHPTNSY